VSAAEWRDPAALRRALRLMVLVEDARVAAAALRGGATALQLRAKTLSTRDLCTAASALRALCARHGTLFLVNDRLDVALACGADGVHLGQDDLPPELARAVAGPNLVIGVSAATPEEAWAAARGGADYLGVGAVYATRTKADAGAPIGLDGLARVVAASTLPVVAIGGIGAEGAAAAVRAGAAGVAVVSAVAGAPDPERAAAVLRMALDGARPGT
jgi:thiamine-phosphate pyrophosphorylase